MTGYACREHPDQQVTWRGTGCRQCDTDARDRQRRARRDADPVDDLTAPGTEPDGGTARTRGDAFYLPDTPTP